MLRKTQLKRGRRMATTPEEREHLLRVKGAGCVCTWKNLMSLWGCTLETAVRSTTSIAPCEAHHLLDCGRRRGHYFTIGLDEWFHRGITRDGESLSDCAKRRGPSLVLGTREFAERFGTDDELLAFESELLRLVYGGSKWA